MFGIMMYGERAFCIAWQNSQEPFINVFSTLGPGWPCHLLPIYLPRYLVGTCVAAKDEIPGLCSIAPPKQAWRI